MALPEQEQLIGAVRDFPHLIENGMTGFKENARHAFQGNEESMRQFYEACNHVLQCLHEMWQTENFCEMGPLDIMEARMKITSQMIKILDMMKDMDVENKKFLAEEHEKGGQQYLEDDRSRCRNCGRSGYCLFQREKITHWGLLHEGKFIFVQQSIFSYRGRSAKQR